MYCWVVVADGENYVVEDDPGYWDCGEFGNDVDGNPVIAHEFSSVVYSVESILRLNALLTCSWYCNARVAISSTDSEAIVNVAQEWFSTVIRDLSITQQGGERTTMYPYTSDEEDTKTGVFE
jgi:hypothetical protein